MDKQYETMLPKKTNNNKKLDLWGRPHHDIAFKMKTFLRRSRKLLNPCPTHTQRHRSPCENNRDHGLDLRDLTNSVRGPFDLVSVLNLHCHALYI